MSNADSSERATKSSQPEDIFSRPIKNVSLKQIEDAFSTALGELTGRAYKVTIQSLDLNTGPYAFAHDACKLELTLEKPSDPSSGEDVPF